MSKYSNWLERAGTTEESLGAPTVVDLPAGPRRPILPIPGRSRTEIEKVVNRLCRGSSAMGSKVIVFTALEASSGCSWICAHSGDLLAASADATVCLVDANLRSPTMHSHLGLPNRNGLADLITDSSLKVKTVASTVQGSDLSLVTSGSAPPEDAEGLVQSDRMRDRVDELRSCFNFVLIDAPPVSICNDALALGQLADGMILVLRAGVTRRDVGRRLTEELRASGVKLLGAILNDYRSPLPPSLERLL